MVGGKGGDADSGLGNSGGDDNVGGDGGLHLGKTIVIGFGGGGLPRWWVRLVVEVVLCSGDGDSGWRWSENVKHNR
ncbi:hypothetical protein Tco_0024239 [Tanacetum coccineum]